MPGGLITEISGERDAQADLKINFLREKPDIQWSSTRYRSIRDEYSIRGAWKELASPIKMAVCG